MKNADSTPSPQATTKGGLTGVGVRQDNCRAIKGVSPSSQISSF
jgi:hypothetical protein